MTSPRKGFSLIEVMAALAVIGLAVIGVVSVETYAFRGEAKAKVRHHAGLVASSILDRQEIILAGDFTTDVGQTLQPVDPIFDPHQVGFQYEVIQTIEDPPDNTLKRVEVVVHWNDQNGPQTHSFWTKYVEK